VQGGRIGWVGGAAGGDELGEEAVGDVLVGGPFVVGYEEACGEGVIRSEG
jgi:hypothetical protein